MTYQCEECGKSLATEGGLQIHMDGHRPAPAPVTLASIPGPTSPLEEVELPASRPAPPRTGNAMSKTGMQQLLVMGLGLAAALIFLVGTTAAVHPSLIRNDRKTTVAADGSHSVAIPDTSSATTAPPTTAAPAPAASGPAPTVAPSAPDSQKVRSMVLQLADYGPGWRLDTSSDNSNVSAGDQAVDQEIDACLGTITSPDSTADFDGPDAALGDQLSASSSATIFATAKDAAADLNLVNDPRVLPCLKSAIAKGLEAEGLPPGSLSIALERFSVPAGKVKSAAIRFIITVTGPGGTVSVFVDMIGLQSGRGESTLTLASPGTRVPAAVEQALVSRLAAKTVSFEQVSA